jgi:transcriptional regulator with XRE-family HTH domain
MPHAGGDARVSASDHHSLADKVNMLIAKRWAYLPKPPGNAAIAKQIREETGLSISTGYLWMLRTGQRGNPTGSRLQAMAKFFDKSPSYFLDELSDEDIELAAALRTHGVRMIALRSEGLSEQSQRAILELVERARQLEKLDARVGEEDA